MKMSLRAREMETTPLRTTDAQRHHTDRPPRKLVGCPANKETTDDMATGSNDSMCALFPQQHVPQIQLSGWSEAREFSLSRCCYATPRFRILDWGRAPSGVSSSLFPASWWSVLLGTLDRNCKQKNGLSHPAPLHPHALSTCY